MSGILDTLAARFLLMQIGVTLALGAFWSIQGVPAAMSALLGGLAVLMPAAGLAIALHGSSAATLWRAALRGESWRWVATLALGALIFKAFEGLQPLPFLVTFVIGHAAFLAAPILDET